MNTFDKIPSYLPAQSAGSPDFVDSDMAALASHMDNCASTRSRFFGLHIALESARSMLCARMVTAAVVAVIVLGIVSIV